MAKVILIGGTIGSGKTRYAGKLCRDGRAVCLSADELMLTLFGQDCGERHDEYAARTQDYLLARAEDLIRAGVDVILDWGFWTRSGRRKITAYFDARSIAWEYHYIHVGEELRKKWLKKRNEAVMTGEVRAYYADEGLIRKAAERFEVPERDEVDVWIDAADEEPTA